MNLRSGILIVFALGLAFLMGGCRHDHEEMKPAQPTNTEKLCGKNWKITAAVIVPDIFGLSDVYNLVFQPCQQDNIYRFYPNGSLTASEGAMKCDPSAPDSQNGNWSWAENETKMNISIPGFPSILTDVVKNDGMVFKAAYNMNDTLLGTGLHKVTLTFSKQ
jgi:hypothetical protein